VNVARAAYYVESPTVLLNCDLDPEIVMAEKSISDSGYNREDAYFHQKDADTLAKRRAEVVAQRKDPSIGKMRCPLCGSKMTEVAVEHVTVDRCVRCGGVFLGQGELKLLIPAKSVGLFKGLFGG